MTEPAPRWSRRAHHNGSRSGYALPAYYKHPRTGVVIEVDTEGITTFCYEGHGHFRPYETMTDSQGHQEWTAGDEIETLNHHGWRRT